MDELEKKSIFTKVYKYYGEVANLDCAIRIANDLIGLGFTEPQSLTVALLITGSHPGSEVFSDIARVFMEQK